MMEPSRRRERLIVVLFILSAVLSQFDRQSIAILKPLLLADLGWNDADYADIVAIAQVASAFALLLTGAIVDRVSARASGALAVFGWSLAMLGQAGMRTVAEASCYRIGQGVFQAMAVPGGLRALSDLLPSRRRAMGFAISNASVTVGGILAPLLLPAAASLWGWRGTFAGLGVFGLVWSFAWLSAYRPRTESASDGADTVGVTPWRLLVGSIGNRRYLLIALGKALSDLTWWVMLFWLPDFFHRAFGLTLAEAGGPLALAYGLCALGALTFGAGMTTLMARGWSNRGAYGAALVTAFALTLLFPAAALAPGPWAAALLVGIGLFGHQGFGTASYAIIADAARPGELGRMLGFSAFCGTMAGSVAVLAAGQAIVIGAGFLPAFGTAPLAYGLSLIVFLGVLGRARVAA